MNRELGVCVFEWRGGAHVFEDRWRQVGGRLGDNVDVARALACARAHSTSIIFYYFNYFEG